MAWWHFARTRRAATDDPSVDNLSRTLRRGAGISAVVLVIVQILTFGQTLVLARLLTTEEVGIFTAGVVLSVFLTEFSEGGLRAALIQREDGVPAAADTVFWASVWSGLAMSLCALAAAPLIGVIFGRTEGLVAAVTSGMPMLHALTNVPDALMQRQFNFKRRMFVDPSMSLAHVVVAIPLCAMGFGVWGLVAGMYALHVVWVAVTWALAGWRPGGKASYRLWREMAGFALPLVVGHVVLRARDLVETFAVGTRLGKDELGELRYGRRLASLPSLAVSEVGQYVLFPAFSRIAGDAERFKRGFIRALRLISLASAPVAALLVVLGESIAVVLLGEPWRMAGVALAAMAPFGVGEGLAAISVEALKGAGRSRLLHWLTGLSLVSGVGLLLLLLPLGLTGVGLSISITSVLVGVVGIILVRPIVGLAWRDLTTSIVPPIVASLVALAAIWPIEHLVAHSDQRPPLGGAALLVAQSLLFGLVYLLALRVLSPASFAQVMESGRAAVRKVRRSRQGTDRP